jgi:hypothetical protein
MNKQILRISVVEGLSLNGFRQSSRRPLATSGKELQRISPGVELK